jgi:undecaprenyl-diphosphatase
MLEKVLHYERDLFLALNGSDSITLDHFMWLYSGMAVWMPAAILIVAVWIYKKDWRNSLLILASVALTAVLCDQLSSGIIKPLFCRLRPTHHPLFAEHVDTVFNYRGGRYGFISGHAANAFGFAAFAALFFRYALLSWTIYCWAAVTAYSRIYLGVHFISDVVPGAIAGIAVGYLVHYLYIRAHKRLMERSFISAVPLYTVLQKRLIVYGIITTVIMLFIFHSPLVVLLH